jgi:alpha-D-xyloside xylohydrolase
MKLGFYVSVLLIIPSISGHAQNFQKTDLGITLQVDSGLLEIQFFTPDIVRIEKWPGFATPAKESLSVIKTPEKTLFTITKKEHELLLKTKDLMVSIEGSAGKVSFQTIAGTNLLTEKGSGTVFNPFNDAGTPTYSVAQSFVLDKDEAIYGLGQQQHGKMIQRNLKLNMIQGNTDDYVPLFQSVKGYGVFWDNYSPTVFEDKPESTTFKSEVGSCEDYYFIYGANADGVIAGMRDLTGQAPMFPLWTFGYWQSKERYKSQNELVDVVTKYRELGVPLDGIIQDWQYWGNNYLWNAMDFLNPEYPNPQKMVNEVHRLNAHMIISIWSSFGPKTKPYHELDEKGMLFNIKTWPESGSELWPPRLDYPSGVRVYDAYNPEAREIYWKYLNKGIFVLGVDGWWMDSTEPDHLSAKPSDFDTKTYLGSWRKVRNAYPLMTVGGVSMHQRNTSSAKRVFILTRSAFAGQQRYGANTWSGDLTSTWTALKNQISAGLNFSLTGIPYWNSDIGGFFLTRFHKKLDDPEYRELYARWIQFGAFCPMMRSHGTDAPREIYQFGKKGDRVYDAIEKYIDLRYRLLPYIYTTSWDVTAKQSSMMRALMMDFPHDKNALDINDQYMFGKSILVAPVTEDMYTKPASDNKDSLTEDFSAVKTRKTYLPAGTDWYDFWTGEILKGGQYTDKKTPLDIIPLYIKAGSIIPWGPAVQYASEKKWDSLELRVYPGQDGDFVLYEDEGDNYNYEKGKYSEIPFHWNDKKHELTIGNRHGNYDGMLSSRNLRVVLVNTEKGIGMEAATKVDRTLDYSGKQLAVKF